MKKKSLLLSFILLILFFLVNVSAELEDVEEGIESSVDKIEDFTDNIQNKETTEEYLTREWTEFIKNSKYLNWVYDFNPLFKYLFGQEFTISWAFFTGLAIWFAIFFLYLYSLDLIFNNRFFTISLSFIIAALTSQLIIHRSLDKISEIVQKSSGTASRIIIIFLIIFVFILLIFLLRRLKVYIARRFFRKRIERAEKSVKDINTATDKAEKIKEGIEDL